MEDKKYKVYCHINKINKKQYIGITKRNPKHRWNNGKGYIYNSYFYNSIEKYGWDNFEHTVLYENLSENQAKQKEMELIKERNTITEMGV